MDDTTLFYYPGDEIKVGDRIQTPHALATVEALVAPGKEWAGEVWPEGLIVIEEEWGDARSSIGFEPYTVGWEDMCFVKRAD